MKGKILISFLLISLLIISACTSNNNEPKEKVKIFKSSSCGCCTVFSKYMGKEGFDVESINLENMNEIKYKYNIPPNLQSCHTSVIGDYVIEGHIPVEAIEKMLKEKPDIRGIAMPGMPSGSPGMPGAKQEDFIIYSLNNDGSYEEYMRI